MKSAALLLAVAFPAFAAGPLYCTGDSQTAPRLPLVTADLTYCSLLAARKGVPAVNLAVPGATSADWLAGQVPQLWGRERGCVTVMVGINDGWIDPATPQPWPPAPIDAQQTILNLEAGIQQALNAGHDVTVLTNWAMWQTVNMAASPAYIRAEKAAATRWGLTALDAYAIAGQCWLNVPGTPEYQTCLAWFAGDPRDVGRWSHPSPAGHQAIAALCDRPEYADSCACRM
jgi:lysophospholipase L1-like esterase